MSCNTEMIQKTINTPVWLRQDSYKFGTNCLCVSSSCFSLDRRTTYKWHGVGAINFERRPSVSQTHAMHIGRTPKGAGGFFLYVRVIGQQRVPGEISATPRAGERREVINLANRTN